MGWADDLIFKIPLNMSDKEKILRLEKNLDFAREALQLLKKIESPYQNKKLNNHDDSVRYTDWLINGIKEDIKREIGEFYLKYGTHDEE